MGFQDAIKSAMNNKFDYAGRASRSEYWFFTLFEVLYYLATWIILVAVNHISTTLGTILSIPILISFIFLVVVGLSLSVRRLHDTNKSGWWLLMGIIPFGGVVTFILTLLPSDIGENTYGV